MPTVVLRHVLCLLNQHGCARCLFGLEQPYSQRHSCLKFMRGCCVVVWYMLQAVVGGIVREKELRLREGMRILGLSVSNCLTACLLVRPTPYNRHDISCRCWNMQRHRSYNEPAQGVALVVFRLEVYWHINCFMFVCGCTVFCRLWLYRSTVLQQGSCNGLPAAPSLHPSFTGSGILVVVVGDPLAHTGCFRPVVCTCGAVPLQAQLLCAHVGLLLAFQCRPHRLLILPQHTVQCIQGGGNRYAVHLRSINDSRVSC